MAENENNKALDNLFMIFELHVKKLNPAEQGKAFLEFQQEFDMKLNNLRNKISEIQYGQHIEGLYSSESDSLRHPKYE